MKIVPFIIYTTTIYAELQPTQHSIFKKEYWANTVKHTGYIFSSPLRWGKKSYLKAAAATTITGILIYYDGDIIQFVKNHKNPTMDWISNFSTPFGDKRYAAPIIGGSIFIGAIFDNPTLLKIGTDGLEASIISTALLVPFFNKLTGRELPLYNENPWKFQFFGNGYSFPSGHTSEAFVLATVISEHSNLLSVALISYTIAGMVGISRVYDLKHFASEIFVGGVFGTVVAKKIVQLNRKEFQNRINFSFSNNYFKITYKF